MWTGPSDDLGLDPTRVSGPVSWTVVPCSSKDHPLYPRSPSPSLPGQRDRVGPQDHLLGVDRLWRSGSRDLTTPDVTTSVHHVGESKLSESPSVAHPVPATGVVPVWASEVPGAPVDGRRRYSRPRVGFRGRTPPQDLIGTLVPRAGGEGTRGRVYRTFGVEEGSHETVVFPTLPFRCGGVLDVHGRTLDRESPVGRGRTVTVPSGPIDWAEKQVLHW